MKNWIRSAVATFCCIGSLGNANAFSFSDRQQCDCWNTPSECSCGENCECDSGCPSWTSTSWVGLQGNFGQGIGDDPGHGSLEAFLGNPNCSDCGTWLPFLDLEADWYKNKSWGATAGLGLRWMNREKSRVWGANLYYDYRRLHQHGFNQVGVGFESLGKVWDFRINGYIPVGKTKFKTRTTLFDDFIGDFFMIRREYDVALTGFDAEFGIYLARCGCWALYGAAGPYYFENHDFNRHFWGGQARVALEYGRYIWIEAQGTHDKEFHSKLQGVVKVMLPFDILFDACCTVNNICLDILSQPVRRIDPIVTEKECCWQWNF